MKVSDGKMNMSKLSSKVTFYTRGLQLVALGHVARQVNLQLQGRKQLVADIYDNIESFKVKLMLWRKQLVAGNLPCFSVLESLEKVNEVWITTSIHRYYFWSAFDSFNCILKISGPLNHVSSLQPPFLLILNALQNSCRWN